MVSVALISCKAFSSSVALPETSYLNISVDKQGASRAKCCSASHIDFLRILREQWQAEDYSQDPNGYATETPNGPNNQPQNPTPPSNNGGENVSSDAPDDSASVLINHYAKECVCDGMEVAFVPYVDQVWCCPDIKNLNDERPMAYTSSGALEYPADSNSWRRCCQWEIWKRTHDMKMASQPVIWKQDEDWNTNETDRYCCLAGKRSGYSGTMEWLRYGKDYKGDEEVGCCSRAHVYASETCCEVAFPEDLVDKDGKKNTAFYDAKVEGDLGKNKCCALDTMTSFKSLADYKERKPTSDIEDDCCEAAGGYYREDENGQKICCNGMKKYDVKTGKWSTEDSDECCVGEGYVRVEPGTYGNDRGSTVCCIQNSTKEAANGGTPIEICCNKAAADLNETIHWVEKTKTCCKKDKWTWKYADEYDVSGGMCVLSNPTDQVPPEEPDTPE